MTNEIPLMDATELLLIGMLSVFVILGLLVYGMKIVRQLIHRMQEVTPGLPFKFTYDD